MSEIKCKSCGGTLVINENETIATCEYCQMKQTLPKLNDDKKLNLYERASHFRRNNEYDKAMGIYEQILEEDTTDAESYWSLVLCRYGIEYVEDPATKKRIPTVNRAQFTSVYDDDNYKSALEYADSQQRELYEKEAKAINEIQKGILAISQKEEPFDIFICYKETDKDGRRTPDSVLANDLYHQLKQEGFKVFFARITLEDKLGSAYEPYIFAALNSSKVMVVLGTKQEHFNAVWVKNEWSRYLSLIKNGEKKTLIPCYRDMDPYDLPDEFAHLQAQDMSKLGFMQDLIRGIKKIAGKEEKAVKSTVTSTSETQNTAVMVKRAFLFLEDENWDRANEYFERVLDIDPENSDAYVGKLMMDLKLTRREQLAEQETSFAGNGNFQKALRFADKAKADELKGCIEKTEHNRLERIYTDALAIFNGSDDKELLNLAGSQFETIKNYKDSAELAVKSFAKSECARKDEIYNKTVDKMNGCKGISDYEKVIEDFRTIIDWKDSDDKIKECTRKIDEIKAEIAEKERKEKEALRKFILKKRIKRIVTFVIVVSAIVALAIWGKNFIDKLNYDMAVSNLENGFYDMSYDLISEIENSDKLPELKEKKYALGKHYVETKDYYKAAVMFEQAEEYEDAPKLYEQMWAKVKKSWKNKVANQTITVGASHYVNLQSDGTVIATAFATEGEDVKELKQCDVSEWENIISVAAGEKSTVGLESDGTVVVAGSNIFTRMKVKKWKYVVAVYAHDDIIVGLRGDGTVVTSSSGPRGWISNWEDIVAVSLCKDNIVGVTSEGELKISGSSINQYASGYPYDVKKAVTGDNYLVAMLEDKSVSIIELDTTDSEGDTYLNSYEFDDKVYSMQSITKAKTAAVSGKNIMILKTDGTVETSLDYDLSDWKKVNRIYATDNACIGINEKGNVLVAAPEGDVLEGLREWKKMKRVFIAEDFVMGMKKDNTFVFLDIRVVEDEETTVNADLQ